MNHKRGFTLVELLVVIAIIALLISLLLPALSKAIRNGKSLKDGTQTKEIHQSMLTFATNTKGKLPTPGLIDRLEDPMLPPNSGNEDSSQNTTRNFYSCMLARELFPTTLLIGPTEVRTNIVNDEDYNYAAYSPSQDQYWDPNFNAALSSQTQECNTSYSHMAICGLRKKEKFRDSAGAGDPIIGTRGVGSSTNDGCVIVNPGATEYDRSPTLLLHDPRKLWVGNVCFGDNHTERLETMYFSNSTYEFEDDPLRKDNLYFAEFGGGTATTNHKEADAFLQMSRTANSNGNQVTTIYDPLN